MQLMFDTFHSVLNYSGARLCFRAILYLIVLGFACALELLSFESKHFAIVFLIDCCVACFWKIAIFESVDCASYGEDAIASYGLYCFACAVQLGINNSEVCNS